MIFILFFILLKGDVFLKFKILKANKKHIKEIQEISTQQFGLLGWAPNFFESELKNENHFFYIAVVNQSVENIQDNNGLINSNIFLKKEKKGFLNPCQKIVGFINFMQTEGELGLDFNILNIATREEFKNKGVASALINFVFQLAKQRKFKSVWLEVRYSNNVAIELYQKLGFQQLYIRKNYYSNGEDAIIFRKIF